MSCQLVVFTDLDATLLDHNNYSFEPAAPALEKLEALNIPVILNSSKTYPEMDRLRQRMGNKHPFIIENGAAIVIPAGYFNNGSEECLNFSTDHREILNVVDQLHEEGYRFRNFNRLDAKAISEMTNLSEADAHMAKERFASEPLVWDDTEENLKTFSDKISSHKLKLIKGGRFYHVIGLFDKGCAIERTIELYEKKFPDKEIISVGLGDSPNDIPMLEAVDFPIVILSGRTAEMKIKNPNVTFSRHEGPTGWNEEITTLLKQHGL